MDESAKFLSQLEELKKAYESGGKEECRKILERNHEAWRSISLDVAVIGNSGVGKSSFINAIRGLTEDDDKPAPVGDKKSEDDIPRHSHPRNPLLKFWDLPGIGTDLFPRETYLSNINVDRFDFFLLITAGRFTENDTWLGKELHKRNKKYFFVRTKVGLDISDSKKTQDEDAVVRDIRDDTKEELTANGCPDAPVFLVDSYKVNKFDFDQLEQSFTAAVPYEKRSALVMSLNATGKKMIKRKAEELRSRITKVAGVSAAVALIPVPIFGVDLLVDFAVLVEETKLYHKELGLDEKSLRRYAKSTSVNYKILEQCESNYHSAVGKECTEAVVKKIVKRVAARRVAVEVVEQVANWILSQ